MPMMIGNPAPDHLPWHVKAKINGNRDWSITLNGQPAPSPNGLPHPTFADYESAFGYCKLLEQEYAELAGAPAKTMDEVLCG